MQLRTYPIMLGKNGMTSEFLKHVNGQLKQHGLVKIRVLKSSGLTLEQAIKEITNKTGSKLLKKIGKTFIIAKN